MNEITSKAIKSTIESEKTFCRYITANDTGANGAHQAGYYMPKSAWPLFFTEPGTKGANKDTNISILWQDDFHTDSRFIYYGIGTRNEYRLTRFGRGFPFLADDRVGDLLVICKMIENEYRAFVISGDDDIEEFYSAFGISSTETNKIIPKMGTKSPTQELANLFDSYINALTVDFPGTSEVAQTAEIFYNRVFSISDTAILSNPDSIILSWLSTEYDLFRQLEVYRYTSRISTPFSSVQELIEFANTVLNRRKSRAGKSLEHHLSKIFDIHKINYCAQCVTESNSKPDFIFPTIELYKQSSTGSDKIAFLAAKTTCKDRWRQILGEAEKIPVKHLFTLQQGISANQLEEMERSKVQLVVPKQYISSFPRPYQDKIWTLSKFIGFLTEMVD